MNKSSVRRPTAFGSSGLKILPLLALLVLPTLCFGRQATAAEGSGGLANPESKEIAMQLVSSAENSDLDWRSQYGYIEDIEDGRGYTAGIIGFTTGTGDILTLVRDYTGKSPGAISACAAEGEWHGVP